MHRTNWVVILAVTSVTLAWPQMSTPSFDILSPSTTQTLSETSFLHNDKNNHHQLYVRETTSTTTDTSTTDQSTTSTSTTSTTSSTASTTSTTSSSTTSTSSTSTSSSTTSTTTTAATTTTSTTSSSSTSSSTSTASTTTATTSASTTTSSSTSTSAAKELKAWNHAGLIRAIVVFSVAGGLLFGFLLYRLIKSYFTRRAILANKRLSVAGSSYSVIPLTAEGRDDARTVRESMMFQ